MKIKQDELFKPTIITLETSEEVKIFHEIGNYSNQIAKIIGKKFGDVNKVEEKLLELYNKIT